MLVILVGLLGAGSLALRPVEQRLLGPRFATQGDAAFRLGNNTAAKQAYTQAKAYGMAVDDRLACLDVVNVDPASCRQVFTEVGASQDQALLAQADTVATTPKQSAAAGEGLVQQGHPEYGRYPLERAVTADPGYSEAWHLLAQVYDTLAARPSTQSEVLRQLATQARARRDAITSKYIGL